MTAIPDPHDLAHMRAALGLARRGLGTVWPNPAVGCVLVRGNRVVGRGWTQPGGRPHAETQALGRAGAAARGATAYVTLEPCCHHGRTPPCADALIEAGVVRVVVAAGDPDPRVGGQGIERLRAAGIAVEAGLCEAEAMALNAGFFLKITAGRPLVTLKLATTLDGRIATHGGQSHWITGSAARQRVHRLRAEHDAIMVGLGTAMADNPELTCRLPGLENRSPVRIVADSHLALPLTSRLVATAHEIPTWVITLAGNDPARRQTFLDCGIDLIETAPGAGGRPDLATALAELARQGLTRVLVEGGAHLAAALLRLNLVDRMAWFRAPSLIGGDGIPALASFGVHNLTEAPRFIRDDFAAIGDDTVEFHRQE